MGFFKGLVGKAISEGVSKGISDAVSASAETLIKPAAEKWAEETAKVINSAAEAAEQFNADAAQASAGAAAEQASEAAPVEAAPIGHASSGVFSSDLAQYPEWTYTPIEDVTQEVEDEYVSIMLTAELTDELIEKYQSLLQANGFTGDWQMMKKNVNGKAHYVDFSFVMDGNLRYLIYK